MINKTIFKSICIVIITIGFNTKLPAQAKKDILLENVWDHNGASSFSPAYVEKIAWMNSGKYYTALSQNRIIKYETTSGEKAEIIFEGDLIIDDYSFSADEKKLLLKTETEKIYRRSDRAEYYIYTINTKKLKHLSKKGKQSYATFSPDGTKAAFTRGNNLFYSDLEIDKEFQITKNGKKNEIINGSTDWVYEEEFAFTKAFYWCPDGNKITFMTFDEREVKEYNMQLWNDLYPEDYRFKYPKAGEQNSNVSVSVYHLATREISKIDLGFKNDIYIPRIQWTENTAMLSVRRLNRLQNKLEIIHADAYRGFTHIVLKEESDTYVDLNFTEELIYLKGGKQFIISSERDGYKHFYLYDINGKLIRQITKGKWEADELIGIDENKNVIYFTAAKESPLERHLYSAGIKNGKLKKLTEESGFHEIDMSPNFQYWTDTRSGLNSPPVVTLKNNKGETIKVLEDNDRLQKTLTSYTLNKAEFFSFKTSQGTNLNGFMIKPADFDPNKKYPVLMHVYGGPGHQLVLNKWAGANYMWYQMLAQKGYIIACIDNRGTGGRGAEFKKSTYADLGNLETVDQIEGAKYLGAQAYIDESRIGIWGWSYGGYMTTLCLTKGADFFKMGIAVAPVTAWRFYDTIYTERYLKRPQDNPEGYDNNSPLMYADKLKGAYLLIHGTGDDNVHIQNTIAMQDALIAAGKKFDTFLYPDRDHSIYGNNTRLHLYGLMTDFIEKNL